MQNKGTYYRPGTQPPANHEPIIGTRCTGCGTVLTTENLSAHTDKVGVCTTCKPRGDLPPGMIAPT